MVQIVQMVDAFLDDVHEPGSVRLEVWMVDQLISPRAAKGKKFLYLWVGFKYFQEDLFSNAFKVIS